MAQGSRPDRVGEQIREEVSTLLLREVRDPGIGLVTLTRVKVSPDLQFVRIFYTQMGDEKARKETKRALERATPFLRRKIGDSIRLRRVPELRFEFDESVEHQERIERILLDLEEERKARAEQGQGPPAQGPGENAEQGEGPTAENQSDSPDPGPGAQGSGPREPRSGS
jgi:ribosome-binding factor A